MMKLNLYPQSTDLKVRRILRTGFVFILLTILVVSILSSAAQASIPKNKLKRVLAQAVVTKSQILEDVASRISPEFQVPDALKKRVGFWFDIYSKFNSEENVIHHVEYPWIIFSVVSTKDILENPSNRWAKFHRSEKVLRNERARVKRVLLKLARTKNLNRLNEEEARFVELLKDIPGKRAKVFKQAANNIRSQLGQKDFIQSGLSTSQKYFPYLESVFEKRGLPVEITRLPLVESSFNEAAVSKVGASGIWQLMPAIGHKFLRMNDDFDERNSPLKATEAAAKLMGQNFKILKSWPLAITAYNHGPGGLIRAQKKLKTSDISKIVEDYSSNSFGFASSNFFCSFLAALHVERYQKELFGEIPVQIFPELKIVEMPQSIRLKNIVAALGLDADEVRNYNLDLKEKSFAKNKKVPKGFRLFVPVERHAQLEAYLETLPQAVSQKETKRSPRL